MSANARAVLFDGSTVPIDVWQMPEATETTTLLADRDVVEVQDSQGVTLARRNDRGELVVSTSGVEHLQCLSHKRGETK